MEADSDALLTPRQVAFRLKINSRHVRRMMKAGQMPGVKRGRYWLCPAAALKTYLEQLTQSAIANARARQG